MKKAIAGSIAMKRCRICGNQYPKRMILTGKGINSPSETVVCGGCVDQNFIELQAAGAVLPNKKRRGILSKMCAAYDRGLLREARR